MPESTFAKLLSTTAMPIRARRVASVGAVARMANRLALQGEASVALRLLSHAIFHGSIAGKSEEVKRRIIRLVWDKVRQHANQSGARMLESFHQSLFIAINRECENNAYAGHVLEVVELFEMDFERGYYNAFWLGFGTTYMELMIQGVVELNETIFELVAEQLKGHD